MDFKECDLVKREVEIVSEESQCQQEMAEADILRAVAQQARRKSIITVPKPPVKLTVAKAKLLVEKTAAAEKAMAERLVAEKARKQAMADAAILRAIQVAQQKKEKYAIAAPKAPVKTVKAKVTTQKPLVPQDVLSKTKPQAEKNKITVTFSASGSEWLKSMNEDSRRAAEEARKRKEEIKAKEEARKQAKKRLAEEKAAIEKAEAERLDAEKAMAEKAEAKRLAAEKAKKATEIEQDGGDERPHGDVIIEALIAKGRKNNNIISTDELLDAFWTEELTPDQIHDIYATFEREGIGIDGIIARKKKVKNKSNNQFFKYKDFVSTRYEKLTCKTIEYYYGHQYSDDNLLSFLKDYHKYIMRAIGDVYKDCSYVEIDDLYQEAIVFFLQENTSKSHHKLHIKLVEYILHSIIMLNVPLDMIKQQNKNLFIYDCNKSVVDCTDAHFVSFDSANRVDNRYKVYYKDNVRFWDDGYNAYNGYTIKNKWLDRKFYMFRNFDFWRQVCLYYYYYDLKSFFIEVKQGHYLDYFIWNKPEKYSYVYQNEYSEICFKPIICPEIQYCLTNPEQIVLDKEYKNELTVILEEALALLDDREKRIILLRNKRKFLEEVGRILGITRERVRQIEKGAYKKILRKRDIRNKLKELLNYSITFY